MRKYVSLGLVCSLEEVRLSHTSQVGGKAAYLGELVNLGFPIPKSFCLTTEALVTVLSNEGISTEVEEFLTRGEKGENTAVPKEVQRIRKVLSEAMLPDCLRKEVEAAHSDLGELVPRVAVRSSAVVEDSSSASFAGQFKSFLNVKGLDSVWQNTKECWASAFSDRVLAYRRSKRITNASFNAGVLVQRMVDVEKAGIVFTQQPVTGDDSSILIEANWGFGESVVGGLVNPDRFSIKKGKLEITDRHIGKKELMRIISTDETDDMIEQVVPASKSQIPCIDDDEIVAIARMAEQVQNAFGIPQDIEWCIADRKIWILQARPITTIK